VLLNSIAFSQWCGKIAAALHFNQHRSTEGLPAEGLRLKKVDSRRVASKPSDASGLKFILEYCLNDRLFDLKVYILLLSIQTEIN
jgi:hypothetical protein